MRLNFSPSSRWWLWAVTALIWALAAASALSWALRWAQPVSAPAGLPLAVTGSGADGLPRPEELARLLGAIKSVAINQDAARGDARFSLKGVVAGTQGQSGAALLSVDGKPPRPYRVGAEIEPGLMLQSVGPRQAVLAASREGLPLQTLVLPTRP